MKKFIYKDLDGKSYEVGVKGTDNALSVIQKRIEINMPVETVEAEKLKKTIESIAVDVQRNITPDEANMMVNNIKDFLISEIDNAKKFYVSKKGKNE